MMTGAGERIFIDTNVLVYASEARAPFHGPAVAALRELHAARIEAWISRQIIREYLAILSRPQSFTSPQPASVLIASVRQLQGQYLVAEDGPEVTESLLQLMGRVPVAGKQIHDANIVATMLVHSIPRLLTQNRADFARFSPMIAVESLAGSP